MAAEHLLEICVLALLAVPALRAATSRGYRRVFPRDAIRLGAMSTVYFLGIAALTIYEPSWLRLPAVLAAGLAAAFLWRVRPGFGVAAGLPPGSLQPLPLGPWSDSEFYAKQARRYGDVFKICQFGRPMVCVLGLERANRLLLEHDQQLVAPPLPFSRFIEGGYLRYLPEETHARYRKQFRSIFHSEAVSNAEPRVAAVFRRGLAAMAEESKRNGSVPVKPRFMRAMFAAWAELFYGIDEQHVDFARLKELFHVIDTRKGRWASRRTVEPALAEIEAILARRVQTFREADTRSPSCFLAALAAVDPQALADRTVLGNLIYIMQVTWGDVTGLLVWVFKMLSDNPEWRARLAAAVVRSDAAAAEMATRIVLETLRLAQSESRYRRAVTDIELDGFHIPKGWLVRICILESHRDPRVFKEPLRFDPDRFVERMPGRGEYAPFGNFRLACIGEDVTKTIAARFVRELVAGFDWQVVDDGPPEINSWVHNAPSARLSARMTARGSAPR